jgi:hypothetical protein
MPALKGAKDVETAHTRNTPLRKAAQLILKNSRPKK